MYGCWVGLHTTLFFFTKLLEHMSRKKNTYIYFFVKLSPNMHNSFHNKLRFYVKTKKHLNQLLSLSKYK